MKTISIFLLILFSSLGFNLPQERTVTGKVTAAEDGTDLPGVNVLVKKEPQKAPVQISMESIL